jgi:GTPase SAR1 family protein
MSQNSSSSLGDGKGNKKDLSRQRAEARRLKMVAHHHDMDIGRMQIPSDLANSAPAALLEDDEGGVTTDDGDSTTVSNRIAEPSAVPFRTSTILNQRRGQHLTNPILSSPGGDVPPVHSIITAPLRDEDDRDNDYADRSLADSTVGSEGDGLSTVSGSGKSLLYGRVPASQQPDQSNRSSSGSVDQNSRGGSGMGSNVLFGKSSSLIFPTGVVDASGGPTATVNTVPSAVAGVSSTGAVQKHMADLKSHKINLLLDQCESVRFPFKKKLMLNALELAAADIPVKDLYRTNLGNSLHKLSLAGNRLSTIPPKLVVCLPVLKTLDLSQCELHQLPERWNLPQLKRLNLSHNRLTDFPEETMLEGLPELHELNMYGNKVSVIIVPHNPKLLSKLEILNLGYNDLAYLPEDLDHLKALRILKVMNNFLEKIPMRVCDMELKTIDVSSNPVIQPPIETCERGICSMKRYYQCLRMEEQSKQKALEALQNKAAKQSKKPEKPKKSTGLGLNFVRPPRATKQSSIGRKTSEDSGSNTSVNASESQTLSGLSGQSSLPKNDFITVGKAKPRSQSVPAEDVSSLSFASPLSPETKLQTSKSLSAANDRDNGVTLPNTAVSHRSQSFEDQAVVRQNLPSEDGENKKIPVSAHVGSETSSVMSEESAADEIDQVTVNDTLKVIFVGMAMAGKTSMIKRLIEGENAVIPKRDERTVGVDIYEWTPINDKRFDHIDPRIELQDKELEQLCGEVAVKFSVWDFAGQHVYHATHELFFSPRALYVLVWDMGASNSATKQRRGTQEDDDNSGGAFRLTYDSDGSDSDDEDDDFVSEEEARRADRALERDIDEKVQFWVDCIQSSAPGSAILPVATFNDMFEENNHHEAKRRCDMLKQRLLRHEARRIQGIKDRLKEYVEDNRANDEAALRLRKLLGSYSRPKLIFGNDGEDSVVRVSGLKYTGFATLTERINNIATGREKANFRYPIFRGHVGARIPRMRMEVLEAVRRMRDRFKVVEWGFFINELKKISLTSVEDISDALHFLTNIGELSYFGGVLAGRPEQTRINPRDVMNVSFMHGMKLLYRLLVCTHNSRPPEVVHQHRQCITLQIFCCDR